MVGVDRGLDAGDAGLASCGQVHARARFETRPIDIILVIINLPHVYDTIVAIEQRINGDFADVIASSGADYRIILITQNGASDMGEVCISGTLDPNNDCSNATNETAATLNPPHFFHYSSYVGSTQAWCTMLDDYASPEPDGNGFNNPPLSGGGWKNWLRPEAHKVIVLFDDNGPLCTSAAGQHFDDGLAPDKGELAATAFDAALTALDPAQFGTPAARNYTFYSFLDIAGSPDGTPWGPEQPFVKEFCDGQFSRGYGYQALSRLTGGLRTPVCVGSNFDATFRAIASGVVAKTAVGCDFPLAAPIGEIIDRDTVEVVYTDSAKVEHHHREVEPDACAERRDGFYFVGDRIELCPQACAEAQADPLAAIEVRYGCTLPPVD